MKKLFSIALGALLGAAMSVCLIGCASHQHAADAQPASKASYPLTKCVVSGEDLGSDPYVFEHNGQTVKLCCKDCLPKFNEDPAKYLAKITAAK
jgi:hypothetical protein